MRDDISKLIIHLNDFSMMPIATFTELTEQTIDDIVKLCNKTSQPKPTQAQPQHSGGGEVDYKHKYEKYKAKYTMMKGTITKLH